ncbi:hypothetical protein ACKP2L_04955 [Oenococcus alcoholitolerans]
MKPETNSSAENNINGSKETSENQSKTILKRHINPQAILAEMTIKYQENKDTIDNNINNDGGSIVKSFKQKMDQ